MLEARELLQECITKGEQSSGYREFSGLAPGLLLLPDSAGYRIYIESLFDELSTEVKVLFDRRDPASVLWPKRSTFEQLLEILNSPDLADIWGEDETIGWVYQFFNSKEERAAMRDPEQGGSQAPRNSRELAIRNQFFTPRYVVQFLTDNTLGRIWYEMRDTRPRSLNTANTWCESLARTLPRDRRRIRATFACSTLPAAAATSCSTRSTCSSPSTRRRTPIRTARRAKRRRDPRGRLPEPRRASEGCPRADPRAQPPRR